jgi:glutathione S-transferase
MPRPDLKALGVEYRRIPVVAIGRDIYTDTRLILSKLEALYPASDAHPSISASTFEGKAMEKLLEYWMVDGGIFTRAAQLIPTSLPLFKDPKFTKDRQEFSGGSWNKDEMEAIRPESLVEIKGAFAFLEESLLADGREWILNTKSPSLADIEGMRMS